MTFNVHPDNISTEDIPLVIRFSDYRVVDGAQIPFHVEKYMNNGLILDLHFQSAALNTGLPASTFRTQ
jgi:outer membrane lipoprotein-sorting protein